MTAHRRRRIKYDPAVECSTPFGIGDDCTSEFAAKSSSDLRCSTPFGIGDDCTPWCRRRLTSPCAPKCSTPFGIGDDCTRNNVSEIIPYDFACSTPFGIGDDCTRRAECFARQSSRCAQRLSASEMTAPPGTRTVPTKTPYVLNAFRHRR